MTSAVSGFTFWRAGRELFVCTNREDAQCVSFRRVRAVFEGTIS